MSKTFLFVTFLLSSLLASAVATEAEDVLHLDLAPLRIPSEEADPTPPKSAFEEHDHISSENVSEIYCSDTTFPSDIFCDVENLERVKFFGLQPVTTKFYLKYRHPKRSQAVCFVSFENPDDSSPSRLVYKSISCYDSLPDAPLEWLSNVEWSMKQGEVIPLPESSLPEAPKVRDVSALEMEDRSTENLSFKCKRRFKKAQGVGSGPPSSVAFDFDSMVCISSAPPPKPPTLPSEASELRLQLADITPEA